MGKSMKNILGSVVAAGVMAASASASFAATYNKGTCYNTKGVIAGTVNSTQYEVQVRDISFCTDVSCSTAASLISGPGSFDLGTAPGANNPIAGGGFAAVDVPVGDYTHIRISIDRNINVTGTASFGGEGICVTKSAGANIFGVDGIHAGGAAWAVEPNTNNVASMTLRIPTNAYPASTPTKPVTVDATSATFISPLGGTVSVKEGEAFPAIGLEFGMSKAFAMTYYSDATTAVNTPGDNFCAIALGSPEVTLTGTGVAAMGANADLIPANAANACDNLPANVVY